MRVYVCAHACRVLLVVRLLRAFARVRTCVFVCIFAHAYLYMRACVRVCVRLRLFLVVCVCVRAFVCVYRRVCASLRASCACACLTVCALVTVPFVPLYRQAEAAKTAKESTAVGSKERAEATITLETYKSLGQALNITV